MYRDFREGFREGQAKARELGAKYVENFKQYCDNDEAKKLVAAGPQL